MTPPFAFAAMPSSFPNAFARTFEPRVLQVVHVTGNRDVAALPDGLTKGHSPYQDWLYAARNPQSADGPSANDYVGRAGSTIEMWDPRTHAAWSNGDLVKPRLDLPGVKYLADLRAKGTNANKGCYREIELSGYPGSYDPTDAQIEVCAWFAATDSIRTGIDIVRGETMLTHADINTVDRQNCAFRPAIREARMGDICRRALEIKEQLQEDPVLSPGDDFNFGVESWTLDNDHTVYCIGGPRNPDGSTDSTMRLCAAGPDSKVLTVVARSRLTNGKPVQWSDALYAALTSGGDPIAAEHERTRDAAIEAVKGI